MKIRYFINSVCGRAGAILNLMMFNLFIKFKPSRVFQFRGNFYNYFYHWYNATWKNERAVEIPIICEIVKKHKGKNILEVGNVLSHYYEVDYDIVDKYEKSEGVINEDVVNFQPSKLYDLIISISTLEHVGWDEVPRKPLKILKAIENLKRILASYGEIVITLPLGYNADLDRWLIYSLTYQLSGTMIGEMDCYCAGYNNVYY